MRRFETIQAMVRAHLGLRNANDELTALKIKVNDIHIRAQMARQLAIAAIRTGAPVHIAQQQFAAQMEGLEREVRLLFHPTA